MTEAQPGGWGRKKRLPAKTCDPDLAYQTLPISTHLTLPGCDFNLLNISTSDILLSLFLLYLESIINLFIMATIATLALNALSKSLSTREALSGVFGSVSLATWIFLLVRETRHGSRRRAMVLAFESRYWKHSDSCNRYLN